MKFVLYQVSIPLLEPFSVQSEPIELID